MNGWFGPRKVSADKPSDETPAPSLPSIWYRSPELYELERRAVFSRKWLLVSHKLRFLKAGDFVRITEAGFQFFLIKDREGNINAFHNVCRHRAYPIIERDCGTSRILACKYHGWSYSFKGALAKAPKYQDLAGFQKESNGLFRIHVHIDGLGFIWVNLDSSTTPGVPWEEDFKAVDCQPRLRNFNFEDYTFDHQWEMLGEYNWKTLADNYNECYHCPTGHPALNSISDFNKYWVETKGGHIIHFNTDKPNVDGLGIYSTFYYPNACMTVTPHFFYMMRCSPISSTQTHMEYEVYRHKDATDEEFTRVSDTFKQVLKEDKDLCNAAQKNLNASIFIKGELHPQAEKVNPVAIVGTREHLNIG
ncbi:cytochrome P450 oxidoreductase [Diaporthe amygdali]|uniref:cytochrome P450 oxidoreductase n=1 Tax=Phomopsis amygdali TaxID=1214568 RepID=UPI0022FE65B2|nr:cytochrome P450 oxidoreductase [Diaporthe amygdali]KAJ0123915.1 cytochrome P450 oxidoreductase [Diaporthe amygdali]